MVQSQLVSLVERDAPAPRAASVHANFSHKRATANLHSELLLCLLFLKIIGSE